MLGLPFLTSRRSGITLVGAVCAVVLAAAPLAAGAGATTRHARARGHRGATATLLRVSGNSLSGQLVTFLISADGSIITEFHFVNGCTSDALGTRVPQGMPIVNGRFSYTSSTIQVAGTVQAVQSAGAVSGAVALGTARLVTSSCDTHDMLWDASTSVSAPGGSVPRTSHARP